MSSNEDSLAAVIGVLTRILQIDGQTSLSAQTRLLGGIPEFDSLAVASVIIGLEEQFGLEFDDEDINAEIFDTVGTLAAFIDKSRSAKGGQRNAPEAYYLAASSGSLFVIRHDPVENPESRCVVFVAPFAEEMNRTRHLMTATAKKLNAAGISCCSFDFYGTGDSAGNFADARWSHWLTDLHNIVSDLRSQGFQKIDLVAVRLGALLAVEYVGAFRAQIARIVFWDPVFDGATYLDRFLRTRSMAAMMAGNTESIKQMRASLDAGQIVEVGGYGLHPELAAAISRPAEPDRPELAGIALYWISRNDPNEAQDHADATGLNLTRIVKPDYEAYWANVETTAAPALIDATRDCLATDS